MTIKERYKIERLFDKIKNINYAVKVSINIKVIRNKLIKLPE